MANTERLTCWSSEDAFVIGVQLRTIDGQFHAETEELVEVDTGYAGDVLVPWNLYIDLELYGWELDEELWSVGISISGEVFPLVLSRGYIVIPRLGQEFLVLIDSFEGNDQFLIGRSFLRRLRMLLDGPEGQTCLLGD